MTQRSANHATFVIERTYPAHPARVFAAWASWEAKGTWMDDPDLKSDGTTYRYDARYCDIVPDQRIVYNYEMYAGEDRMSVSLATVETVPAGDGARLTYTEQGAFLDGIDTPDARQGGTEWILDNLGKYLAAEAAG